MLKGKKENAVKSASVKSESPVIRGKNNTETKKSPVVFLLKTAIFLFIVFISLGVFWPKSGGIDHSSLIKQSALKQVSGIVAGGESVKWSILVRRSEIDDNSYLLKLPSEAKNIKIETIDAVQAQEALNLVPQTASLKARASQALARANDSRTANGLGGLYASVSDRAGTIAGKVFGRLALRSTNVPTIDLSGQASAVRGYVMGEAEQALPIVEPASVSEVPPVPTVVIPALPTVQLADSAGNNPSTEASTNENTGSDSNIEKTSAVEAVSPTPIPEIPVPPVLVSDVDENSAEIPVEIPQVVVPTIEIAPSAVPEVPTLALPISGLATTTSSHSGLDPESDPLSATGTDEFVKIDFETPAPIITERETDSGKIVTISDPNENPETPLTDVLASASIPPIYKVGQESKIKIKWKNNGGQDMTFHAYDTDEDGFLDYVEWTVPHLSEQIFEIIFISKAFLLDVEKNIIADIYDETSAQDGVFATVGESHYVRVTFKKMLTSANDITLFARPTADSATAQIEVYPVYTDEHGDLYQGAKLEPANDGINSDFSYINADGKFRILLSNLQEPTDVFDLKIIPAD